MNIATAMVLIITTVTTVSRNAPNSRIAYPDKVSSVVVSLISSGAKGLVVERGKLVVLETSVVPPLWKRKSVRRYH